MDAGTGGAGRCRRGQVVQNAHLPRQAAQPQAVAAVRRQVQIDGDIVQAQGRDQVGADLAVVFQLHNGVRLRAQIEFGGAAQHACRLDPAQFRLGDLQVPGQFGAHARIDGNEPRPCIGRPANHLVTADAVRNGTNLEIGRIGMGFGRLDTGSHHILHSPRDRLYPIHFEARHGELLEQRIAPDVRVDPLPEPGFAEFHLRKPLTIRSIGPAGGPSASADPVHSFTFPHSPQAQLNCLRKRRSFSKNRRLSLTS